MKKNYFTLIELLFVTALLAIIAGGALFAFNGVEDSAQAKVESYTASQVFQALVKFRKDMGYYPKESGVLDFASTENSILSEEEFNNPQNFHQLFEQPENLSSPWDWDPDSARGWNGPYLSINGAFRDGNLIKIEVSDNKFFSFDPLSLTLTYDGLDNPVELPK